MSVQHIVKGEGKMSDYFAPYKWAADSALLPNPILFKARPNIIVRCYLYFCFGIAWTRLP